jgi:ribosomal protein S20
MKGYVLFSIFMFITALGGLGFGLYSQYQIIETNKLYNTKLADLENKVINQREDKNKIRDLWESQTVNNDKLILAQLAVDQKTEAYIAEIKRSLRFINTVPQLLPTVNEDNLKKAESELLAAQKELDTLIDQNAIQKNTAKEKIDALYLQAGEDQSNRANPRDGIR